MTKENARAWMVCIALHKAAVEYQSHLIGTESGRGKQIFNQWNKQGAMMLTRFDGVFSPEILEAYSEGIEESIKKLNSEIDVID